MCRGRILHVDIARPARKSLTPHDGGTRLFVENLPFALDERELAALFAGAATVRTAEIARVESTGESLGRGWIEISPADDPAAVVAEMNGIVCRTRRLRIAIATLRGSRRIPREMNAPRAD